jgi:hypothetical protein
MEKMLEGSEPGDSEGTTKGAGGRKKGKRAWGLKRTSQVQMITFDNFFKIARVRTEGGSVGAKLGGKG